MSKQTDLINMPDAITVDGSNVGIGTSSPSSPKFSSGASGVLELKGTKPSFNVQESDVTNAHFNMSMNGGNAYLGATGTGNLILATGTADWSERMRIDSSGNVGIGTSPSTDWRTAFNTTATQVGLTGSLFNLDVSTGDRRCMVSSNAILNASGDFQHILEGHATIYSQQSGTHRWYTAPSASAGATASATERMRIDSSGRVGIGTDSPANQLHLTGSSSTPSLRLGSSSLQYYWDIGRENATTGDFIFNQSINGAVTERMRISSGRLLVGKTASGMTANGVELRTGVTDDYAFTATSLNQPVLLLNRHTDNGMIIRMRKANSDVGAIGNSGSGFYISGTTGADFGVLFDGSGLISCTGSGVIRDNQYDMGHGGFRWNDIYATNGSINTSDFNEKQDIASLTATEMLVGKRISALFKTFRWKDAVVEKGDNARTHTGVIAQDVQAAFTAEGLDVGDYALFTSFTWWEQEVEVPAVEAVAEVTDEDGNVTTEAIEAVDAYTNIEKYNTEAEAPEGATIKTRLGIRYLELLSFVAAYNEQRFASIEARLTALEA
jgi:hypothetical protein